jgi:hypothetical protein
MGGAWLYALPELTIQIANRQSATKHKIRNPMKANTSLTVIA